MAVNVGVGDVQKGIEDIKFVDGTYVTVDHRRDPRIFALGFGQSLHMFLVFITMCSIGKMAKPYGTLKINWMIKIARYTCTILYPNLT